MKRVLAMPRSCQQWGRGGLDSAVPGGIPRFSSQSNLAV